MDTTVDNQNITTPHQNQIPQNLNNSFIIQRNVFLRITGTIVLFTIVAAISYYLGLQQNKYVSKQPALISPSPLPTNIKQQYSYRPTTITSAPLTANRQVIDLFKFELNLPADWDIGEVNRRPAPKGADGEPRYNHDCADYVIADNDRSATLSLFPHCDFSDGGADLWPSDAVIVKELGNNSWIIRYFDTGNEVYRYSNAYEGLNSDENGTRLIKTYSSPPIISIGEEQNLILFSVELKYTGSQLNKDKLLQQADAIISSLKHL